MKHLKTAKKYGAFVVLSGAALVSPAYAEGMDYSAISSAVSFTTVLTGMSAVALTLAGILVARKGAGILLGFISRGR